MKKEKKLQPMSIVIAVPWDEETLKTYKWQYPWKPNTGVLYLGEIKNMPGHCVVSTRDGKVHWGYHTENFRAATEDEV